MDIKKERIIALRNQQTPLYEPGLDLLLFQYPIVFTDHIADIPDSSIVYICTGTPPDAQGYCDISSIYQVIDALNTANKTPSLICIKSTIAPGTMSTLKQYLNGTQLKTTALVYNPEFMREGSALQDIYNTNPIVIGGESPEAIAKIESLYQQFLVKYPTIRVIKTNHETAELIKYGWNGFSALRITFFNELNHLCQHFSADMSQVIEGIAESEVLLPTKNIKPGCGFGGSCLPKDVEGLSKTFENYGLKSTLMHQTLFSNQQHIQSIANRVIESLANTHFESPTVAILGLTFKANTDDIRNAPSITIIQRLMDQGYHIHVYDPYANFIMKSHFPTLTYFTSPYEAIDNADCILILTEWPQIKELSLKKIASLVKSKKIIDPKGLFNRKEAKLLGYHII